MAIQSFTQDVVLRDKEEVARLNAVFDEVDRRAQQEPKAKNPVSDPNEAMKMFLQEAPREERCERPYRLVPLNDLISRLGDKNVTAGLRSFVLSRDTESREFLHNKAVQFEKSGKARTYLAIMDDAIAGYFTLATSCLRVPAGDVSKFTHARMNMDPDTNTAPTYLLGQLGELNGVYGGFGGDLLEDALALVEEANVIAGCRLVRIDCAEELTPYYEQRGFRYLRSTEAGEGRAALDQLVRAI